MIPVNYVRIGIIHRYLLQERVDTLLIPCRQILVFVDQLRSNIEGIDKHTRGREIRRRRHWRHWLGGMDGIYQHEISLGLISSIHKKPT